MNGIEIQELCGKALILKKGMIPKDIMKRIPQTYVSKIGRTVYPYSKTYISFFVDFDLWCYKTTEFFPSLSLEIPKSLLSLQYGNG